MKKLLIILTAGLMTICGYSQTILCDSTENIKLKKQVEDVMKSNEVVTGERDLLYTNFIVYNKTTNIKQTKSNKLIKGLLIGGSIYVGISLPIIFYFMLK